MSLASSPIENTQLSHSTSNAAPESDKSSIVRAIKNLGFYLLCKIGVNGHAPEPHYTYNIPALVLGMPKEIVENIIRLADSETQKNIRLAWIPDLKISVSAVTQKLWINNSNDLNKMLETYKHGGIDEITITNTEFSKNDLQLLQSKGVNVRSVNLDFAKNRDLTDQRLAEIIVNIPAPIKIKNIDLTLCSRITPAGLDSALQKISEKQEILPNVIKPTVLFDLDSLAALAQLTQLPDLTQLPNLTQLNLDGAAQLTQLPDLSQLPNLTNLILTLDEGPAPNEPAAQLQLTQLPNLTNPIWVVNENTAPNVEHITAPNGQHMPPW